MEVMMKSKMMMSMVVVLLLILSSMNVESKCDCCEADRAKACCFACIAAGGSDTICKNTCCFPCFLSNLTAERSVQDFCKLGCISSACTGIVVTGNQAQHQYAVTRCHDACHHFCYNKDDANLALGDA